MVGFPFVAVNHLPDAQQWRAARNAQQASAALNFRRRRVDLFIRVREFHAECLLERREERATLHHRRRHAREFIRGEIGSLQRERLISPRGARVR